MINYQCVCKYSSGRVVLRGECFLLPSLLSPAPVYCPLSAALAGNPTLLLCPAVTLCSTAVSLPCSVAAMSCLFALFSRPARHTSISSLSATCCQNRSASVWLFCFEDSGRCQQGFSATGSPSQSSPRAPAPAPPPAQTNILCLRLGRVRRLAGQAPATEQQHRPLPGAELPA